ncbi:hypothetical protein RB594_000076 [Gaeumannomyces avenae]
MNCPSRTDEPLEEHPDWNQSPPFLSPDLTTCQDLNGIANARVHRKGSDGAGAGTGAGGGGLDQKGYFTLPPLQPDRGVCAWGWWSVHGPHPRERVTGGEGLSLSSTTTAPRASSTRDWLLWIASVLACSALLSGLRTPELLASYLAGTPARAAHHGHRQAPASPTSRALGRRSTCPTDGLGSEDEYNTPLHVGALVIVLVVSFSASAFPLLARALPPRLRVLPAFFFAVRHFGTGVLLATAFVHLLPTAFSLLSDPCLSSFWVNDYPAMPGAIALAGVFFVTVIEMALQPARHMTPGGGSGGDGGGGGAGGCMSAAPSPASNDAPAADGTVTLGRRLSNVRGVAGDITPAEPARAAGAEKEGAAPDEERQQHLPGPTQLTPQQKHQKDILQCMMLEVGILFHSVFIGMTLSVSVGQKFVILLVAISFHQMFEGLALGSRIAAIAWPEGSWQPWLMSLAYGCTTPIGQAIGIATHTLYNPGSEFGLVLVGTMNAISSGLLVFASLVELLSEDFLSDESWRVLRGRRRVTACLLVLFGAAGMSLVGAWA